MNLICKKWTKETQRWTEEIVIPDLTALFIRRWDENNEKLFTGDVVSLEGVDKRNPNMKGVVLLVDGKIVVRARYKNNHIKDFDLPPIPKKLGSAFETLEFIDFLNLV